MESVKGVCSCMHHKMIWVLMVAFGLIFFLGNLNVLTEAAVTMTWPILVMVAGLTKMMGNKCKCCSGGAGVCCMNCGKEACMCK